MRKQAGLYLILFLFLCVCGSPCIPRAFSKQAKPEPVVLQLKWKHQFQFAGYYAALEKGLYRDAGLDLTVAEGGYAKQTVDEVVSGRAQYGVTNSEVLLHRLRGEPVVVLAAIFQHSPLVLVSHRDKGITSPQNLVGKRVKMSLQGRDTELHASFLNEGISLNALEIVDASVTAQDYLDKNLDALSAYVTNEPFYLKQAGIPYVTIRPNHYGIDFYGDCLFTTEEEIAKHPDRVKAFLKASLEGWIYAMQHQDEMAALIHDKFNSEKSMEHLLYEACAMDALVLPNLVEMGHMNPGRWEHIAETFVRTGIIKPDYSLEGFLYNPNPEPDFRWLRRSLGIALAALLGAGVIALILFNSNRKLTREISFREKVELEMQALKNLFEDAINSMPSVIAGINAEGRVTLWNRKAELETGLSADEARGQNLTDVLPELDFLMEKVRLSAKTGEISRKNKVERKVQDQVRYADVTVFPLSEGLESVAVVRVDDVTEQVRVGEMMVQAEKMISLGSLAAGMAHEINNPLAIIMQNAEVVLNRVSPGLAANQTAAEKAGLSVQSIYAYLELRGVLQMLQYIREAGEKAAVIVGDMMGFGGNTRGNFQKENLDDLLDVAIKLAQNDYDLARKYDFKNIEIIRDYRFPDIPLLCERSGIQQVILDLLRNAASAMRRGDAGSGRQKIELRTSREGDMVRIEVEDNGPGMDEATARRVFEPFFTTNEVGEGTGLGLSASYFIITQSHKGKMTLETTPGLGSKFIIHLPIMGPAGQNPDDMSQSGSSSV
ncbi:PAS domain S-box-containing protein [Desulfatibacillum alkenivorans DSM 16219]|jgi:PAS domain S-box-containing protein|uniref:histidine kinase n=1 Tax=Desulfatibacillum alkenivorans DSM 16219 TaxID=1121393 RepID=A0A1M6J1W3_9BACT|nr:ABC transporter substrate-binding protein [Desulfatibacillum alkenivorans]SHJ40637.1 PAS domain S-box-containing protein [Desulfatibacillum alkenivorans DSM 16219]